MKGKEDSRRRMTGGMTRDAPRRRAVVPVRCVLAAGSGPASRPAHRGGLTPGAETLAGRMASRAGASGAAGPATQKTPLVAFLAGDAWGECGEIGYTPLDRCPEVLTGVRKIASLIGATTLHLMENTPAGDVRVRDELARMIDIAPTPTMTRAAWMEAVVQNLLLYGAGNAIVLPHYEGGYLADLEPIAPARVCLTPVPGKWNDYLVYIDGVPFSPNEVLHFTLNPDPVFPWKGKGVTVSLRDAAGNLRQTAVTENAFLSSQWKPSIIVKVDALADEFSGPEGRQRLIDSYLRPSEPGAPWLIPSEQFSVEQVKPLTLKDLAISDTAQMNRRTIAAVLGVPPYVLGVGDYKQSEWNAFIQSAVMTLCKSIAAEMTRKLILSPQRYLRFNVWSLMDYDLEKISRVLLAGSDRGFVCGDEWRDRVNLAPAGLSEYRALENYIPWDDAGKQSKLTGGGESKDSGDAGNGEGGQNE